MQAGSLRERQPAIDASSVQVLIGESPKQRHARTPRPDAADPKSNPGSPYQRHEGTPRPDAASPCAGELIAACCICSIAGQVRSGVGILLAFNVVAVRLSSCWPGLLPVCVAVLLQVQAPDSPLPPAHCCLCCESDSRQCVLCAAAVGAAHLQAALGQAPAPRSTQLGPLRAFGSAAAQVCQEAQGVLPAHCYLHCARPARLASRDRRAVVDFLQGQPAST